MSVEQGFTHEKFKSDFEKTIEFLLKGLGHISAFIHQLYGITGATCQRDDKYIADVLFPFIEKAKTEFDEMAKYAEGLLQQINSEFERCVANLKSENDKLKKIDSNLNELEKELEGANKAVDCANNQCKRKREHLVAAENALSDARRKLEEAEKAQKATYITGVSTAAVSAVLTFMNPVLGIAGMAAGFGAELVSITVLHEKISLCSRNASYAQTEVQSSEEDLEKVRNTKTEVEKELVCAENKKKQTETEMEEVNTEKNRLEEFQKLLIIFDEDYRKFHRLLCDFYGKYQFLRFETSGGYDLQMLQSPTMLISASLKSLCQSEAIHILCEQPMLAIMRNHFLQIEDVKWQTDEQLSEMDDII